MTDFKTDDYLKAQQEEIASRRKGKPKILKNIGEEGTFVTKPYTVKHSDSGFEMMGKGAADIQLTGPRPQRPDQIIQDPKDK